MIQFKSGLAKKEIPEISSILIDLVDKYGDFYITRNNLRLFIKDNFDVLCDCLKKGDKIVFGPNGIVIVTGYSDNSPRKYLKILTKDLKDVEPLLQVMFWNLKEKEVYIKLKNNNPLKDFLLSKHCKRENGRLVFGGFEFVGGRGKETLLRYVCIPRTEPTRQNFKDKDE
jgi:hypothetical protein